jgi:hypothetical protein
VGSGRGRLSFGRVGSGGSPWADYSTGVAGQDCIVDGAATFEMTKTYRDRDMLYAGVQAFKTAVNGEPKGRQLSAVASLRRRPSTWSGAVLAPTVDYWLDAA